MHNNLFRSLLFVPSHNRKLMISASKSEADVLLLDVEDSVQPSSNKQIARDTIIELVDNGTFKNKLIFLELMIEKVESYSRILCN